MKRSTMRAIGTGMLVAVTLDSAAIAANIEPTAVTHQYAEVAHAVFADALIGAQKLADKVDALIVKPSNSTLNEAREAWLNARIPYQQSEVYRFGNTVVDDWEGQLNAWPLDEGLIDYVAPDHYQHEMGNVGASANIIASNNLVMGSETLSLDPITPDLLASLNELAGSEANVATGYHAIEFLLWGQDLNGTDAGAGERPYTDYVQGKGCTGGHCERRVAYLKAAMDLLLTDLAYMEQQWRTGIKDNYRAQLAAMKPTEVLTKALFGMGSLALGELAGERMKVALEANSTEDEHDCFSDNTHNSHFYNAKGIWNVYYGKYTRLDGSVISGPSMAELVAQADPTLAKKVAHQFDQTMQAMQAMVDKAEAKSKPMKFDQMIAEGNQEGEKLVSNAVAGLVALTREIENVADTLGVKNLSPDDADHSF